MFQGLKKAYPYLWMRPKVEVKLPLSVLCGDYDLCKQMVIVSKKLLKNTNFLLLMGHVTQVKRIIKFDNFNLTG